MIEIDEKKLIQDLYYTRNSFSSGVSKDMIKNDYAEFSMLNDVLATIFGKMFRLEHIFRNADEVQKMINKFQNNNRLDFLNFAFLNQELIHEIFTNYTDYLKSIDFKHIPYVEQVRRYSEKDFIDLILSYYSTYGDLYYKAAKKYFDENRIHMGFKDMGNNAAGFYSPLIWLKSGYIISMYKGYNTWSATSFCHELGHAIDAETFIFPQQKVIPALSDMLMEVPSTTFELGFLDYLKRNKIDVKGSEIIQNDRIMFLKECANNYDVIYNEDDVMVELNGDVLIPCPEKYPISRITFNEDGTALVDNKLKCEKDSYYVDGNFVYVNKYKVYHYREDMLYGLGYYFALHLNMIKDNSMQDFKKVFNNIITSRKECSLPEIIEKLGIRLEDFVSGELIKPKIAGEYLTLKKRYNVY